jgi:hypothetical protein
LGKVYIIIYLYIYKTIKIIFEFINLIMVKLTVDMISKSCTGQNKRRPDETVCHYLNRLTHIYLQEKNIEEIVMLHLLFMKFLFLNLNFNFIGIEYTNL